MAAGAARRALCFLWALLCAGSWSLISGQTSEVISVPENQSVTMPCKAISGQTPSRLEWRFERSGNRGLVYFNNQFTNDYKNRAEFHPNEIVLKSTTRQDSGRYTCEVIGSNGALAVNVVELVVQVPPSKPKAEVPSSVTIGNKAVLTCLETDGSPQPTFRWYKNDILMPVDPKTNSLFKNSSYTLDTKTGLLTFEPVTSFDAGDYACEADNKVGPAQKSETSHLEPSEVNVGGIVAAVVVLLIVFGLLGFAIWFAYSRGYFSKRRDTGSKKVIYSQPSTRSDGEFKQTSSFLV